MERKACVENSWGHVCLSSGNNCAAQWRGRFVLKTAGAMIVFHQVITVVHNGEEGLC